MFTQSEGGLPFQQDVTVREPRNTGVLHRPHAVHERVPLNVFPQEPDEPIRKGDFWDEGKPLTHAWSHGRRDFYFNFASLFIETWTGAAERVAKYVRANIVRTPLGAQHAFVERVNIERAPNVTYGSLFAVQDDGVANIFDLRADYSRRM